MELLRCFGVFDLVCFGRVDGLSSSPMPIFPHFSVQDECVDEGVSMGLKPISIPRSTIANLFIGTTSKFESVALMIIDVYL